MVKTGPKQDFVYFVVITLKLTSEIRIGKKCQCVWLGF